MHIPPVWHSMLHDFLSVHADRHAIATERGGNAEHLHIQGVATIHANPAVGMPHRRLLPITDDAGERLAPFLHLATSNYFLRTFRELCIDGGINTVRENDWSSSSTHRDFAVVAVGQWALAMDSPPFFARELSGTFDKNFLHRGFSQVASLYDN